MDRERSRQKRKHLTDGINEILGSLFKKAKRSDRKALAKKTGPSRMARYARRSSKRFTKRVARSRTTKRSFKRKAKRSRFTKRRTTRKSKTTTKSILNKIFPPAVYTSTGVHKIISAVNIQNSQTQSFLNGSGTTGGTSIQEIMLQDATTVPVNSRIFLEYITIKLQYASAVEGKTLVSVRNCVAKDNMIATDAEITPLATWILSLADTLSTKTSTTPWETPEKSGGRFKKYWRIQSKKVFYLRAGECKNVTFRYKINKFVNRFDWDKSTDNLIVKGITSHIMTTVIGQSAVQSTDGTKVGLAPGGIVCTWQMEVKTSIAMSNLTKKWEIANTNNPIGIVGTATIIMDDTDTIGQVNTI